MTPTKPLPVVQFKPSDPCDDLTVKCKNTWELNQLVFERKRSEAVRYWERVEKNNKLGAWSFWGFIATLAAFGIYKLLGF